MSETTAFLQLREQAVALRRAGKSRREIKELLGITNHRMLRCPNPQAAQSQDGTEEHRV
jgi:hypothetical protein